MFGPSLNFGEFSCTYSILASAPDKNCCNTRHAACRPRAGRPVSAKRQPLERGRADYTRQTTEDSPLRVVLFPSLPPSVAPSRSVLAVGRSFGRSPPPSLPLAHSLPFPSSNSCRSAHPSAVEEEQAISSACQVGDYQSRAAVKNRAFIQVPNCQAQESHPSRPCRRRSTQNRNSAAAEGTAAESAGAISIVFP